MIRVAALLSCLLVLVTARAEEKAPPKSGIEPEIRAAAPDTAEDGDDDEGDDDSTVAGLGSSSGGGGGDGATLTARLRRQPYGATAGTVSLVTDYISKGQTQTAHGPAIQGGVDWKHPIGVYAAIWGSNVRFEDDPSSLEMDFSAGWGYRFNRDLNATFGVARYYFFQNGVGNSWEFPLRVTFKGFRGEVAYTPDWGRDGDTWYANLGWADEVFYKFKLGAFIGRTFYSERIGFNNYYDFKISLAREILGLDWELSEVFVDKTQFNGVDDARLVLSVSKSF